MGLIKISLVVATIFRNFSGNEASNWGSVWLSGNILELFLAAMLAAITVNYQCM